MPDYIQPGPPAMTPPSPGEHESGRVRYQVPGSRYYNEQAASELKGTVPDSRLLWALLFRPSRFMLSHAVHVRFSQVFVIMWLTGALAALEQFEFRDLTGRAQSAALLNTWAGVWGTAIGVGLVRGMLRYWLGGYWFRIRLYMCGVRRIPSEVAGRVFAFLHFPATFAGYLYFVAASLTFDSFQDYLDSESAVWSTLSFVTIGVVFYSSVITYASVRGVFDAKRLWAVVWFLILPILTRATVVLAIMAFAWMAHAAPKPDLGDTKSASTATMTVRYPGNWTISVNEPDNGPAMLIELTPTGHDALIALEILYYNPDDDPIAETEGWLQDLGFELLPDPTPLTSWGSYQGTGFEYRSRKDGGEYVLRMFFSPMAEDAWLEVREVVHADSAEVLEPGLAVFRQSAVVRDPVTLPADVDRTRTLEAGGVRFKAPGNWWLTRWVEEDPEPGTHPDFRLRAESSQSSIVSILGYTDSPGARSELSGTLENLGITGRMDNERPLDRWLGLEGLGIEGIDRAQAKGERDRLIRVIVSERADGSYIEVLQIDYLDTQPLTAPGFELIESTFEADEPKPTPPAQPDPSAPGG